MLACSARKYLNHYDVCPGENVVVFTNNDTAYQTAIDFYKEGIKVQAIVDVRNKSKGDLPKIANKLGILIYNNHVVINTKGRKKINSVIFLCTTLNVLNETEQVVMQNFIRNGGGYLGIHSAADTEYDWEWYGGLVGGYFKSHPKIQPAKIITTETNHIATKHLEKSWEIEDEWYNYKDFNPEINVLLYLDESSYVGGENGDYHPITWFHEYDGGRSFYTGLGHKASTYYDERFIELLKGGIYYVSTY